MLINHVLKRLSLFIWYVGPPEQTGHTSPFSMGCLKVTKYPVFYCKARKTFSFPFLCRMLLAAKLKGAHKVGSESFQPSLFCPTHPSTEYAPGLRVELNLETILTGKHQAVLRIAPCPVD